jgi:protein-L-isoaspartate(D-aspartate) O-methyltransferase
MARVTDLEFPKHRASSLAKLWGRDYWDGDRRSGYGGYHFREGFWTPVAISLIKEYNLTNESRLLDIGCGKGFLLAELRKLLPGMEIHGLDLSRYAIDNAHETVKEEITFGTASNLPYAENLFDLAISINVLHNLQAPDLFDALREIIRVSHQSYVVVESYDSELQKENLIYWQLTCEAFLRPTEWAWWFELTKYDRDFEFIFFD